MRYKLKQRSVDIRRKSIYESMTAFYPFTDTFNDM